MIYQFVTILFVCGGLIPSPDIGSMIFFRHGKTSTYLTLSQIPQPFFVVFGATQIGYTPSKQSVLDPKFDRGTPTGVNQIFKNVSVGFHIIATIIPGIGNRTKS